MSCSRKKKKAKPHRKRTIIIEVINHCACGFIISIDMDKRVFVHNRHIVDHTSIPITVGMRVMYVEQLDFVGRKVVVNCKIFNSGSIGKGPRTHTHTHTHTHTFTNDRSRSKCRRRDVFKR